MQYVADGQWTDAEMLTTLTSPDVAQTLWRSRSRTAETLRTEFGGNRETFMEYVRALHEQNPTRTDAKLAWAAYQPART